MRRRLSIFFLAAVAVPMIVAAVLVVQISEDSREGKADARLSSSLETTDAIYDREIDEAPRVAKQLAGRRDVAAALAQSDRGDLADIARQAVRQNGQIAAVTFFDPKGKQLADAGTDNGVATTETVIVMPNGNSAGSVLVAGVGPDELLEEVQRFTNRDAALLAGEETLSTTTPIGGVDLPDPTEGGTSVELPAGAVRAAALALDQAPDGAKIVLFTDEEPTFVVSEPAAAAILAVFFAIAFLFIALLLRNLQHRIAAVLAAARRIGAGDFTSKVPVEGNDEMAGLAREFNKMSDQLSAQVGELRRRREELDQSVQRIGEAFASGLDQNALLEIVVHTAVDACDAQAGRVQLLERGERGESFDAGAGEGRLNDVLTRAGSASQTAAGRGEESEGDLHAIAAALIDRRNPGRVVSTVAIAREGKPFNGSEREVLSYLVGQTAISIENIGLHERVAIQARTDELTGLANNRDFSQWMEKEVGGLLERGEALAVILLDIDNFKAVNDTHGHLVGDRALEELGRVLRLESRGIDRAARWGGEEFVLGLPATDGTAAMEAAERLRRRIERTRIMAGPEVGDLSLTASFGVATMPRDGTTIREVIAAADLALYRSKRDGKNRVSRAGEEFGAAVAKGITTGRRS